MAAHAELVNIHEAKTTLSKLIEAVQQGQEIIIGKAGKPVAKLVPYVEEKPKKRQLGGLEGQIWMAPDFDEIDEDIDRAFNQGEDL